MENLVKFKELYDYQKNVKNTIEGLFLATQTSLLLGRPIKFKIDFFKDRVKVKILETSSIKNELMKEKNTISQEFLKLFPDKFLNLN